MTVTIRPTAEQVEKWINQFVPEKDLFFLADSMIDELHAHLNGVLVMPRKEFFAHSTYSQTQMNNSYMYWTLYKQVTSVIVAPAGLA